MPRQRFEKGMSVTELVVAMTVSGIVMVAAARGVASLMKSMKAVSIFADKHVVFERVGVDVSKIQNITRTAQLLAVESGAARNTALLNCLTQGGPADLDCIPNAPGAWTRVRRFWKVNFSNLAVPPRLIAGDTVAFGLQGETCPPNTFWSTACPYKAYVEYMAVCPNSAGACAIAGELNLRVVLGTPRDLGIGAEDVAAKDRPLKWGRLVQSSPYRVNLLHQLNLMGGPPVSSGGCAGAIMTGFNPRTFAAEGNCGTVPTPVIGSTCPGNQVFAGVRADGTFECRDVVRFQTAVCGSGAVLRFDLNGVASCEAEE